MIKVNLFLCYNIWPTGNVLWLHAVEEECFQIVYYFLYQFLNVYVFYFIKFSTARIIDLVLTYFSKNLASLYTVNLGITSSNIIRSKCPLQNFCRLVPPPPPPPHTHTLLKRHFYLQSNSNFVKLSKLQNQNFPQNPPSQLIQIYSVNWTDVYDTHNI